MLLAVAGGLFGFIQFYESKQLTTMEAADREQHVLNFNRDDIDEIVITSNEDKIDIQRHGPQWDLVSPVKDRADQAQIAELFTKCEMLDKTSTITEKDKKKLKEYGVTKSNLKLKLVGKKAPPELLFGRDAAVEGKQYVGFEGSNSVFVVGNDLRGIIARKADDFRDHRLSTIDVTKIDKLTLKTAAGEIELSKDRDHWQLTKPLKARADDAKINDFLATVFGMQIFAFVPEKGANLNTFGLSEPLGTITVSALTEDKPVVLELGGHDEKGMHTYARLSNRGSVYLLPKVIDKALALKPNDFRDRHLMRVDLDLVDRITLEPAGKPKLVFQRTQEDWILRQEKRAANSAKVRSLVDQLQSAQVTSFVSDVAADLAKYGLDHPRLRVRFSSYASENTAETTAGERPLLSVAFGAEDEDNIYARVEDEPFVVAVPKSLVNGIDLDSVQWRSLAIFEYKPEQITRLEIAEPGQPTVAVVRNGKEWKRAEFVGEINPINVKSVINTLAKLSDVAWTGTSTGGMGFEKPAQVVSFTTDDGKMHKLIIGGTTGDHQWNAMVEGEGGTFTLSAPDASVFKLSLLKSENPTHSPVSSGAGSATLSGSGENPAKSPDR
jgi:hypothetical protein